MSADLQALLTHRADSVTPPAFAPWAVIAEGERRVRRRNRRARAGVVLGLAVASLLTAVAVDHGRSRPEPTDRPGPVVEWTPGTRPLAYGQEQTVHLGESEIDTGIDFLSIDVTDDGAALTTIDGGIWFTDGRTVERIGSTIGLRVHPGGVTGAAGRPRGWVSGDTAGSLLAWLEYRQQQVGLPELVVYDTAVRSVLARVPIDVAVATSATVRAVADRQVFVEVTGSGFADVISVIRYDVDTGTSDEVEESSVEAARRGVTRALVVGASADDGALIDWDGDSVITSTTWLTAEDTRLEPLVDPSTGDGVSLQVPPGSEDGVLWPLQWLDDDRFTLIAGNRAPVGELLVCSLTAARCHVAIERPAWAVEPLLPGDGGVGAELAMGRAIAALPPSEGSG
jgi:hypothetical protein